MTRQTATYSAVLFSLLLLLYTDAWAQVEVLAEPVSEEVTFADPDAAAMPLIVEYSNDTDRRATEPGGAIAAARPERSTNSAPKDTAGATHPSNSLDYGQEHQVDALANFQDAEFEAIWNGDGILLFSFDADPGGNVLYGDKKAVYYEDSNGCEVLWVMRDLNNPNTEQNSNERLTELDALNTYSVDGWSYSYFFSQQGDGMRTMTCVGVGCTPPPPSNAAIYTSLGCVAEECTSEWSHYQREYISRSDLHAGLVTLGLTGAAESDVDLDALMARNETGDWRTFDDTDRIIFSIRAAGNFDGDELIKWEAGQPMEFLVHGGHPWDLMYDAEDDCGTAAEQLNVALVWDVDALDAIRKVDFDLQVKRLPAIQGPWAVVLVGACAAVGTYVIRRWRPQG